MSFVCFILILSELLYTGVSRNEIEEIQQATGFKLGTLPVKYLGVPLVTRRLATRDCSLLVQKKIGRASCRERV